MKYPNGEQQAPWLWRDYSQHFQWGDRAWKPDASTAHHLPVLPLLFLYQILFFFSLSAQKAESCNFSCFHLEYKFHLLGCINIVIVLHPLSVHSKNTAGRIQFMTWQSDCTLLFAFLYYLFPHYCIKNKLLIFVCKVPQCLSPSYSIFYTHKFCFHLPSCL